MSSRSRESAPVPRRLALAPAVIAAMALLIGVALLDSDAFLVIRFVVSIFALIIAWFAVRARHWWWVPPLGAIAVVWNPVLPIAVPGDWWLGMQYIAVLVVVAAGMLIRIAVVPASGSRTR